MLGLKMLLPSWSPLGDIRNSIIKLGTSIYSKSRSRWCCGSLAAWPSRLQLWHSADLQIQVGVEDHYKIERRKAPLSPSCSEEMSMPFATNSSRPKRSEYFSFSRGLDEPNHWTSSILPLLHVILWAERSFGLGFCYGWLVDNVPFSASDPVSNRLPKSDSE